MKFIIKINRYYLEIFKIINSNSMIIIIIIMRVIKINLFLKLIVGTISNYKMIRITFSVSKRLLVIIIICGKYSEQLYFKDIVKLSN